MNGKIPPHIQEILVQLGMTNLRPSQEKSVEAGLFEGNNLLVCTPTASGKTLVGEMGILETVIAKHKKGVYVVPLRALASEKYKSFQKRYQKIKVALTSGDMDSDDRYLEAYDIIITTSEILDSLIRHHAPWLGQVGVVVLDEIHLLNDVSRGPTLEIVITVLRRQIKDLQVIGLSATIGNAPDLARWIDARLIEDTWRPVKLEKGIYLNEEIYFPDEEE